MVEKCFALFQNGFKASPSIEYDVVCACEWAEKYQSKNGYTNLERHINRCHPNHKTIFNGIDKTQTHLESFLYSSKTKTYFGWLHLGIARLYPFNFFESKVVRLYSKLDSMSVDTSMTVMDKLAFAVEKTITETLPEIFALVFDG